MARDVDIELYKAYMRKRKICMRQAAFLINTRGCDYRLMFLAIGKPSSQQRLRIHLILSGLIKFRKWYKDKDPRVKKRDVTRKNHCKVCGRRIYKERVKKIGN